MRARKIRPIVMLCLGAGSACTPLATRFAIESPTAFTPDRYAKLVPRESAASPFVATTPCGIAGSVPKGRGAAGGTIALSGDESSGAVADTDNDTVVMLAVDANGVRADRRIAVGRAPAQVAVGSDGRVFVTERQGNTLSVYDSHDGRLLCRAAVAADPVGIALSPDERTVYVTSGITHTLTAIDTADFAQRYALDVPREPRGIAITRDGTRALVAHLAGQPMTVADLGFDSARLHPIAQVPIPNERRPERVFRRRDRFGWDWEVFKPTRNPDLADARGAHGPAMLSLPPPVIVTPPSPPMRSSSSGFVRTLPGTINALPPPVVVTPSVIVRQHGSVLVAPVAVATPTIHSQARPPEPRVPTVDVPQASSHAIVPLASQAWSVAINNDSDEVYVPFMVNRTGREVPPAERQDRYGGGSVSPGATPEKISFALGVFNLRTERWSVALPDRDGRQARQLAGAAPIRIPTAVAVRPGDHGVIVASMGSNVVTSLSKARRGFTENDVASTVTSPCGVVALRDGRELVFSQMQHAIDVRNGGHHETVTVGADALPADVERGRELFFSANDPRLSSGGLSCGGCHPDGRDDGLVWFLSQGPRQTPTLAGRLARPFNWNGSQQTLEGNIVQTIRRLGGEGVKASEVSALAAFLERGLQAPTRPVHALSALEQHGREVFNGAASCNGCHDPEQNFTDGVAHVLGGLRADESRREFDTPSLRFVSTTAPYFHDGRYATLRDVLADPRHRMGHASELASGDITALTSYLATL